MKRRKRPQCPKMLLWDARTQANFIANVERFGGLVNDMQTALEPAKRKKKLAAATWVPPSDSYPTKQILLVWERLKAINERGGCQATDEDFALAIFTVQQLVAKLPGSFAAEPNPSERK